MRQNIQLQPEYHSAFLDSALSEYFRHAGDRFAEESAVFCSSPGDAVSVAGCAAPSAAGLLLLVFPQEQKRKQIRSKATPHLIFFIKPS